MWGNIVMFPQDGSNKVASLALDLERGQKKQWGVCVSDQRRTKRADAPPCSRCRATLFEVATIPPKDTEPGLIAYECPSCGHVTSVLLPPERKGR
jgi:hypothetical protein